MTIDLHTLDPFTPIWRGRNSYHHAKKGRVLHPFHLRPDCPLLTLSTVKRHLKGRLGAMLASGRLLCPFCEANETKHQQGPSPMIHDEPQSWETLTPNCCQGVGGHRPTCIMAVTPKDYD